MHQFLSAIILIVMFILSGCTAQPTVAPSPTPSPVPTATATHVPSLTPTSTETATHTPTATMTPTATLVQPARSGTPAPEPGAAISSGNLPQLFELIRYGRGRVEDLAWLAAGKNLAVRTSIGTFIFPEGGSGSPDYIDGQLQNSPDGSLAAALAPTGQVVVYAVNGWKQLYTLEGRRAAFSTDGKLLAAAGRESVRVVDALGGTSVLELSQAGVGRLLFSSKTQEWVTFAGETAQVWKISGGSPRTLDTGRVLRAVFSADGSMLVTQGRTKSGETTIHFWDSSDWSLAGSVNSSGTFTLQPDGRQVFVFTNYPAVGKIEIFQVPQGKPAGEIRAGAGIYRMAISPDSKVLAVSVPDPVTGSLQLYDTGGKLIRKLVCEFSCDAHLPLFSADSRYVAMPGMYPAAGFNAGSVVVYEAGSGKLAALLRSPRISRGEVEQILFSPDSKSITAYRAGADQAIRSWQIPDGKLTASIDWAAYLLNLAGITPDGKTALVSDELPVVRWMDLGTGNILRSFENATQPVLMPKVNQFLISELNNGRFVGLTLRKFPNGEKVIQFGPEMVPPVAVTRTGDLLAVLKNSTVQLLNLPGGKFTRAFTLVNRPGVRLVLARFSTDGRLLAAGDGDGTVWVWQTDDGKLQFTLEGHQQDITGLVFSPDGSLLATGSVDGLVKLWGTADGKLQRSLNNADLVKRAALGEEQSFGILGGLDFSPDGQMLAMSGVANPLQNPPLRSGAVLLVKVGDGSLLRVLRGGGGPVIFSEDGRKLLASGDGALRVWGVLP